MQKIDPALSRHLMKSLPIVKQAALEAGEFLRKKFGKFHTLKRKSDSSFVTEADVGSEKIVTHILKKHFPKDEILGEEGVYARSRSPKSTSTSWMRSKRSSFCWHIDPLDGTTNFIHQFPIFCISIGLEFENNDLVLGVIHHPLTKDLYWAVKNQGAFLNRHKIHVSKTSKIADAMLCTGFSYKKNIRLQDDIDSFGRIAHQSRATRRTGSAALDLAWVASGQFDGFWERGLNSWDIAAGIVLITEAGGQITDIQGKSYDLRGISMLASNGKIHQKLIEILRKENKS